MPVLRYIGDAPLCSLSGGGMCNIPSVKVDGSLRCFSQACNPIYEFELTVAVNPGQP